MNRLQDNVIDVRTLSSSALETLEQLEMPATPANYAIWYEYHSGLIPNLKSTMDVLISNNVGFSDETLKDLYTEFFSSEREAQAVRETSIMALETLQEIVAVAEVARVDAQDASAGARQVGDALKDFASGDIRTSLGNLKVLIENLVAETRTMAGQSEYVSLRMRESAEKIENLERNLESAIRDASLDGLTGIANRKCFDSAIRKIAGEAMNSGDDLALLMIDIDRFKKVNDTWGHQIGDSVLRHLAKTVQKSIRGEDLLARYGGEEFAVILPRSDEKAAVTVAENIRNALAREPVPLELIPPFTPITISIGIALYNPEKSLADWIQRTDLALYGAKQKGRDRVELYREEK